MTAPTRLARIVLAAALAAGPLAGALAPPAAGLASSPSGGTVVSAPSPRPAAPPPPYTGRAYALGDSVMLGARDRLRALNYTVDAKGSRFAFMGYDVLRAALPALPRVVVVHMGTNYGLSTAQFDAYMRLLGPRRTVVWVTVQLRNDYRVYTFESSTNTVIRSGVKRYPNARLVDWNKASESHKPTDPHPWLIADGIHLTETGRIAYSRLINGVVRA